jgi:hypothetical protein
MTRRMTRRPRIVRNCVGQYLLFCTYKPSAFLLHGWQWSRNLKRGGNYYTEDRQSAERLATVLGITIEESA